MRTYEVVLTETFEYVVEVDAEDSDHAGRLAKIMVQNGDVLGEETGVTVEEVEDITLEREMFERADDYGTDEWDDDEQPTSTGE